MLIFRILTKQKQTIIVNSSREISFSIYIYIYVFYNLTNRLTDTSNIRSSLIRGIFTKKESDLSYIAAEKFTFLYLYICAFCSLINIPTDKKFIEQVLLDKIKALALLAAEKIPFLQRIAELRTDICNDMIALLPREQQKQLLFSDKDQLQRSFDSNKYIILNSYIFNHKIRLTYINMFIVIDFLHSSLQFILILISFKINILFLWTKKNITLQAQAGIISEYLLYTLCIVHIFKFRFYIHHKR